MIIGFDLETTGLDKKNDRIIEIALVKFDEKTFQIVETFSTFVNPQMPIPELISNITNIFDCDVENAPTIEELKKDIYDFIGNTPILGHNVFFDTGFFIENGIHIQENRVIDTFFLANILCREEKSLNLEVLCKTFEIGFSGAHRAINDVNATIALFEKLTKKFHEISLEEREMLQYIFLKSEDKNIYFLYEYLFEDKVKEIQFATFEKRLLKKVGKLITIDELYIDKKLKNKDIVGYYDKLGSLEKRENQLQMTHMTLDAFSHGKKLVIEAPTGLGKSFAYLIPAILHSVKTGEKVFVSTKTKALQDQLYFKDLSALKEKIDIPFLYTKLKGKRNYASIRGFFDEFLGERFSYEKVGFLSKILLWLHQTKYGELDDLNYFGQEFLFLRFINADSALVVSDDNPYLEYEYIYKARQKLKTSNIIVLNHSLLFADLKTEKPLLGKIKNLVLDEAHNIEDSVTDSLRLSLNEKSLNEWFEIIEKILTAKNIKKITFLKYKDELLDHMSLFFDFCAHYLNGKAGIDQMYKTTLLQKDFFDEAGFFELQKKIELGFIDVIDFLATTAEYDFTKEIGIFSGYLDMVKVILKPESDEEYIKMIHYNDRQGLSLEYTLLQPGKYLQNNLWKEIHSLVMTSATLKIGESFDYIKQILSLDDFQFHSFESDFNYSKQATLFIPNDLGSIKNNTTSIVQFLGRLYSIVRGNTLTLLTSFNIIRRIYTESNLDLKKEGIHLYAQGVGGSKMKLLSFFLEDPSNSILLGTDSFWEGVDISGDTLKYLIIHKFPFSVPTDPIFQARSVFFKDPFKEYAIPKAIIKLQQGFGRLIRGKNDTGIVILLDDRIINTGWGKVFFNAFPSDINVKIGKSEQFLEVLEKLQIK